MKMKRILIVLLVAMGLLSSCDLHTSDNGDLDGFWYLTQVDSIHNGVKVGYREERIFWSFTGALMVTQPMPRSENAKKEYVYHFEVKDNHLCIKDAYRSDRVVGDEPITEERLDELKPFGINKLQEKFLIEELNGKAMQLKSEVLRLHFEKY